jgi:hypothetical protein
MSALPLVKRGGEWVELDLPNGHPAEPVLRKARVLEMSAVYGDQASLLGRLNEKEGRDVYVAQFNGLCREHEEDYDSYAVWSKGIRTLLPRTERIVFYDEGRPGEDKVAADVSWRAVQLHCGGLLRETRDAPPRFLVEEFPSPDQIAAMIAR